MANNNIINTRICLKYDSWDKWDLVKDTFTPLKGEICIVDPGTKLNDAAAVPCLIRIGDGETVFSQLPWLSALAADVYAWAKRETPDWSDFPALPIEVIDNEDGKFVTDIEYVDNTLTIHRSDVDWNDVQNKPSIVNTITSDGDNIVILTKNDEATGDVTIIGAHKEYDKAGETSDVGGSTTANGTPHTIKVPNIKVDTYGHVEFNGEIEHTITIPETPHVGEGDITIEAGEGLTLGSPDDTFNVNQDNNETITLEHAVPTGAAAGTTTAGKVITGVTTDKFGHITGINESDTTASINVFDSFDTGTSAAIQLIGPTIDSTLYLYSTDGIKLTNLKSTNEAEGQYATLTIDGSELQDAIDATDTKVNTLIGTDTNKSARAIATEVAKAEIGSAGHLKREIVTELPAAEGADPDTIYMVPAAFEVTNVEFIDSDLEPTPDGRWGTDPNWTAPYYAYFAPTVGMNYQIRAINEYETVYSEILLTDGIAGTIIGKIDAKLTPYVDPTSLETCSRIQFLIPESYSQYPTLYAYFSFSNTVTGGAVVEEIRIKTDIDSYKEFIFIDGHFVQIGDTSVNLDGYATEEWTKNTFIGEITSFYGSIQVSEFGYTDTRLKYLDIAAEGVKTSHIENKAVTVEKLDDDVFNKLYGDYKTRQTAVVDPTANGNTDEFIASITQNENGEITATKKSLPVNIVRREFVDKLPTTGEAGVQYYVNTHGAEIPYQTKFGRVVKTDTGYTLDVTEGSYITLFFEKHGNTDAKLTNVSSDQYDFMAYGSVGYMSDVESGFETEQGYLTEAEPLRVGTNRQPVYDHELSINTSACGNGAYDASLVWVSFYTNPGSDVSGIKIVEDVDTIYTIYEYIDGKFVVISAPGASANTSMFVDEVAKTAARAESKADVNTEAIENLHTIAKSGSIYDIAEGSHTSTGTEDEGASYIIFNCGTSTTVI